MIVFSVIALVVVIGISGLHLAWAARKWWPISDEAQLTRAVAGFPNIDKMPSPAACLFVAFATGILAVLLLVDIVQPETRKLISLALLGAGFVFLGRGAVGFTACWARATPEQPFRRLDRSYYSPLCLALGITFVSAALT